LFLIVPEKLYGLWYSPYLPAFFFVSAISVGCAMVIFESFLSARAFNKGLEMDLLGDLARVSLVMLAVLATMKFMDLLDRGALPLLVRPRMETYLYWLEVTVGMVAPIILFSRRRVRESRRGLFAGATLVIIGFILNRMNISITGMEASAGVSYFPSWMEIAITTAIVTAGFVVFTLAAKHLPIFHHQSPPRRRPAEEPLLWDLEMVSRR
jgi:Ni/Fe-hydrogenase subunit HybB-like protein